jgi:hypothetical protein
MHMGTSPLCCDGISSVACRLSLSKFPCAISRGLRGLAQTLATYRLFEERSQWLSRSFGVLAMACMNYLYSRMFVIAVADEADHTNSLL